MKKRKRGQQWPVTRGLVLVALAGLLAAVVGCASGPLHRAVGEPSAQGQELLFLSTADGELDIYLFRSGAKDVIPLTRNDVDDLEPAWSPDLRWIAYTSRPTGNPDVWLVRPHGTGARPVTQGPGFDGHPSWGPDGDQIAFESDRDGRPAIYVVRISTGETRRVSPVGKEAYQPVWSPRGDWIAFLEPRGKKGMNISLVRPDGSGYRPLTENPKSTETDLQWSPDGRRIAFAAKRKPTFSIYTIAPDGSGERQLTDAPGLNVAPRWSPDGTKIAFLSSREDGVRRRVFVMNADGSNQTPVGVPGAEEGPAAWSADGITLAFSSSGPEGFRIRFVRFGAEGPALAGTVPLGGNQFAPVFPRAAFARRLALLSQKPL